MGGPSSQGDVQDDIWQEEKDEIARIEETQGVETTVQLVSTDPSSSRSPSSPQALGLFSKR